MQIQVKLFANLKDYFPGSAAGTPFTVTLSEGASLQDLIGLLNIPTEQTRVVFVNGIVQPLEHRLKQDDNVGIFPPIGGGANE